MAEQEQELGYSGMLSAGMSPAEAHAKIRALCMEPATYAVIQNMQATEEGRKALAYSRERWATYGFKPPWEDADPAREVIP